MKRRILFTAIAEKGHLNPMIGPAVELQKRGHDIAFYCGGNVAPQVNRAGLQCIAAQQASSPHVQNHGEGFAQQVRDPAWLRNWIKTLLVDEAEAQVAPVRRVIQTFCPDVIVTDPMIYACPIAAHEEGIPWVALSNSLNPVLDPSIDSDLLQTVAWLSPARTALFQRHGMEVRFSGCDLLSPFLTIAFTTEAFVGRRVEGVELVGPSIPHGARGDEAEFPWDRLRKDQPMVYLSFGSQIYHQPEIFGVVIEATRGLGVQLVIAANQLHDSPLLRASDEHVITSSYAPQLSLLPHASAFITHGGANSVMESIYFGVPMLISPVCNDQFHQAHFIARTGIGRVLDLYHASVQDCRSAILALLHDELIQTAMKHVAASFQTDGATAAALLIEKVES